MNPIELFISEPFFRNAAIAGLIASLVCGLIGPIILVKRITSITGGIAHSVLGGMGIAVFMGGSPSLGALVAAIVSAILISLISSKAKRYEEVMINAIWALGMAIGIICISKTSGYGVDLNSYLFGNILMVSNQELEKSAILASGIFGTVALLYKQILALCFDEEFAFLRGIRVQQLNLLLLCVVAVTVVVLLQIVGLIMVIALLSLPAATAMLFSKSLGIIMVVATFLGATSTISGLICAYELDLPAGATIIVVASLIYIASLSLRTILDRTGKIGSV